MKKPALNKYPILDSFKHRWSPRAYSDKPVEKEKLRSIFEAARWAPSARNEQPWRFILGQKGDKTWEKIFESLDAWNQEWTKRAPVLVANVAKTFYEYKHLNNETALYDTGQAVAMMVTEAVNQGLIGHQMGGFNREKAIKLFQIPDGYRPMSVTAIGYYGNASLLPEDMYNSEIEDRKRFPLNDLVFSGSFGNYSNLFE
jgi:nitroreductase